MNLIFYMVTNMKVLFKLLFFDEVGKACLEYAGKFAMFFYILKKKSGMKLGA